MSLVNYTQSTIESDGSYQQFMENNCCPYQTAPGWQNMSPLYNSVCSINHLEVASLSKRSFKCSGFRLQYRLPSLAKSS